MRKYIFLMVMFLLSELLSAKYDRGKSFDLQQYVDSELSKGNKQITIPAGVYRVTPKDKVHLCFNNLSDVTIMAQGVEMICTETTQAISIRKCKNFSIVGLTIDYDPLCFTQGVITGLSFDKREIMFKLDNNYPDGLEERIEIFNPQTLTLRRSTYYGWGNFEKIDSRTYKISKGANYKYNPLVDTEEVGDIFVTNNRYAPGGSMPHAIYSDSCIALRLMDITLYSGNCFGYFETNGTQNSYIRCRIDRRPQEQDYCVRAKRIRSNNADAFHSKYAFIGPQLIGCSAQYQGDDGINICGKYYFSLGGNANTIKLVIPQNCDLHIGDQLEVLTFNGKRLPTLKIQAIENDGYINADQIAEIAKINQNANNKKALTCKENKVIKLLVDKEVNFALGAVVGDCNRMGNGFLIQNCNFSFNRSRGILIKASNGKVINNTLEENWMSSLLISPEVWWLESGCSDNILVKNNIFIRNKCNDIIKITGTGFDDKDAPVGMHNNIVITGNKFICCLLPTINISSTQGGEISNNLIITPRLIPNIAPLLAITLINCKDIVNENNNIE